MEQLCFTGKGAGALAERLFSAIPVRPVGYRLLPFSVGERRKGLLMHLLMQPEPGVENDLPCRLFLSPDRAVTIREVYDEVAAPALVRCLHVRAPILLDGLDAEALSCASFREAAAACLAGDRPVVAVAAPGAEDAVRALLREDAAWFDAACAEQDALLDRLQEELAMRL